MDYPEWLQFFAPEGLLDFSNNKHPNNYPKIYGSPH
jgi:hypothetical protein